MKYYERKDCRLCSSKNLHSVLNLTPTPWADDYRKRSNLNEKQETIPLDILMCKDCNHGQLSHVIDAKEVYLNYTYETASTLGLGEHFKKTTKRLYPSIPPCTTSFHLISAWYPSICHRAFGQGTLYDLLRIE